MIEKNLLSEISLGNIDAFEQIFFMYQPRLVHFLTGFVHDTEISKDMSQDIFLSLWKDRHKLCDVDSFSSYLFAIARFKVYNYFDHLVTQNKYSVYQLMQVNTADSQEEKIFADELRSLIVKTIEAMPPQQQRVFKMSREKGLSNTEIAETLNISKRTVENHITSALSVLRKVIYSLLF